MLCDNSQDKYYFVDAVNRYFDVAQIGGFIPDQIVFSAEINKFRLEPDKFNLEDSFYYKGTPRAIEDFYFAYEDQLRDLMSQFLKAEFQIRQVVGGWRICESQK